MTKEQIEKRVQLALDWITLTADLMAEQMVKPSYVPVLTSVGNTALKLARDDAQPKH